jgi:hypothetical protein
MTFNKIISQNSDLNRVQNEISRELQKLNNNPLSNVLFLENAEIGTSDTEIVHNFGAEIKGWFIVRLDTDARVWEPSTQTPAPKQSFYLRSSAACTVSLIIF